MRAFVCHKIKKGKARYSAFLHRVEDWIVNTIKKESEIMYNLSSDIKEVIDSVRLHGLFLVEWVEAGFRV